MSVRRVVIARLAYAVIVGLVGAAIVHIAIVLMLPYYATNDAWTRLESAAPPLQTVRVDASSSPSGMSAGTDPFFGAVACRFVLGQSPVRISAAVEAPFWSVSIYDRRGLNVYSINDRVAAGSSLDLILVTPAQRAALADDPQAELEHAILVELSEERGIAVLRAFVPDPSYEPVVDAMLSGVRCAAL